LEVGVVRVLVVDDDEAFRRLVVALLSEIASVIEQAADGDTAITLAHALRLDLVVMDIEMPRVDGLTAARAVRKTVPSARVVFLTGTATESKISEASQIGPVVRKDVSDLRAELRALAVE
jgi:CheY-like chemotaxis protein